MQGQRARGEAAIDAYARYNVKSDHGKFSLHCMNFDKEQERRGHKFCRYSDDRIIIEENQGGAKRVLNSVTRYTRKHSETQSQPRKSKVVSASEGPYLCYIVGATGALQEVQENGICLIAERRL